MGVSTIRTRIAVNLATISGLRAADTWPDTINCPAAIVVPREGTYHQSMGAVGVQQQQYDVVLLIAPVQQGLSRAQDKIDPYLDPTGSQSIKAAVESDKTLGGQATTCHVNGWSEYGQIAVNEIPYWGVRFEVEVNP
jgi:hypothetical protein